MRKIIIGLILLWMGCQDTKPPEIRIISPPDKATVAHNVTIIAEVEDNRGVAGVDFYIDDLIVGKDTTEPYCYNWQTDTIVDSTYHTISARAYDISGNEAYSEKISVLVYDVDNRAPNPPEPPAGPSGGDINVNYNFATYAFDPESNPVFIRFDWGNGEISDWSQMVNSGYSVSMFHTWSTPGSYQVRAQAKDIKGEISEWSPVHQIIIPPPSGHLRFTYKTGDLVKSSPAIGRDGTIYFGSDDSYLYAVQVNGILKWRFPTGGYIISSPAIAGDGTIYFGSYDRYVYALNPDGSLKWRFPTGGIIFSSPALDQNGTIYIGSTDSYLYALNPDGSLRWRYRTGDGIYSSPAIGLDGTIYFGSYDYYLYALNPDGSLQWRYPTGYYVVSSPAIGADGTVYVGSHDTYLYALNPDGTLKWRFKTANYIESSPVIGGDGTVYFGSDDFGVYALNPDGSLKWVYRTSSPVNATPAIGIDGKIYIGAYRSNFFALNPDGSLFWRYIIDIQIYGISFSSAAIWSNGALNFGATDGYLYVLQGGGGLASSAWPMFHHDLRHTGRAGAKF
ncbi:MAG: PQQ-binding-like beta-propeller repeat protein [candidate division WOR-3 bacterium]